jgi:hypothetical protein
MIKYSNTKKELLSFVIYKGQCFNRFTVTHLGTNSDSTSFLLRIEEDGVVRQDKDKLVSYSEDNYASISHNEFWLITEALSVFKGNEKYSVSDNHFYRNGKDPRRTLFADVIIDNKTYEVPTNDVYLNRIVDIIAA